jgi:uncharacterized membrane protein
MGQNRANAVWNALVVLLFAAAASVLCFIVAWRYAIFRNDVDLGIFTQVVGSIGRGFSSTAEGGANHLLVHWSPIIGLAWPALRTFGPLGLEYFQAIAVAATLFPIWGLARARFNAPAALGVVSVAALYPTLCGNGVGDFHEMAFVPFLSASLVYAMDRRRWMLGALVALLLACTKEDQFVVLAVNGLLFAAVSRGDRDARRFGLVVCGIAVLMACAYFGMIREVIDPHVRYGALGFFNWSGQQFGWHDVVSGILAPRVSYVLIALVPLAFLPCVSRYGLFLIPGFVEILAAHEPVTIRPGAHYSALLTGYALAAFVDGTARANAWRPRAGAVLVAIAAAASMYVAIFASPMEYWYYLYRPPNAHDALLESTLHELPPRADVGTQGSIFSHMGLDPNASVNFSNQQWLVFDVTQYSQRWHDVDEPAVREAIARSTYAVVSDRDGIVVLRRRQ